MEYFNGIVMTVRLIKGGFTEVAVKDPAIGAPDQVGALRTGS